jgi:hypothetical protein
MIFVDFGREVDKKTQLFFVFYFSDSYCHSGAKIKKVLRRQQKTRKVSETFRVFCPQDRLREWRSF